MKYRYLLLMICSYSILIANQQSYHLNIWAQYNHQQENFPSALEHYQQLVQTTDSVYAYKGFVEHLFATNHFTTIIAIMSELKESFADDSELQLMHAQALEQVGNTKEAHVIFVQLHKQQPNNFEIAYYTAASYALQQDATSALSIINTFLHTAPDQPRYCLFYFLKAQLLLAMGKKEEALINVQKSIELHPQFDKGWLMLGMLHELEGRVNEAIQGYTAFIELTGPDQAVEQQITQLLLHKDAKPPTNEAVLLKINALTAAQKLDEAFSLLESWMIKEPDNALWFKAGHLLYRGSTTQQAIAQQLITTLQHVEKKHPQALNPSLYLADIYLRTYHPEKALTSLQKVLKNAHDVGIQTKVLYQMGVINYTTGNMNAMKSTLDQCLQISSDYPPAQNLLAYYYATDGNDIKQAQALLDNVLKHDGNNPHFLDTQAVIWISQKKYKKAHKLLEQLIEHMPNDFFIHNHLALTHYKQGHKKQGQEYARKALMLAHNEQERALCKKFLKHR